jgi:hypothetical protein
MSLASRTFEKKSCFAKIFLNNFSYAFSLGTNKEDLLHVTHCIISLLSLFKIHLYHGYFNMSCHWHMNIYYLFRFHVNILTFVKKLLTKKQMSMQKMIMEKCLLHLTCGNNYDGFTSGLCMVFNFLYTSFLGFINHKFVWILAIV